MAGTESSDGGSEHLDEPTVLLVAAGERLAPGLKARLIERGVVVELAPIETAARTAFVVAPDLVVLAGRAAEEGGAAVLAALAERPVTATVPVVLVTEQGAPRPKLSSFRHGLVAVIERSASADEMARRIAELARELPERAGETGGRLEETSVDELVELFAESLRSGILSVSGEGGASAQVVLRADRPVAETIAELVERIRPLVASRDSGPLTYEFHESAPSRLSSFDVDDDSPSDGTFDAIEGRRVLLVEQSAPRSDVLAQHLRAAGATVAVVDGAGRGLELARDLTPELVLIDGSGVESWAAEALRAIRRDPWLRWASLLVVDASRLWANPRHPDLAMIAPKIAALVGPDEDLSRRVQLRKSVAARLDVIGPIRMLRALASTGLGLRMRVNHPRTKVVLDLAEGLIAGATAHLPGRSEPVAEGPAAVGALLGLGSGRVQITHEESPKTANVMAPIDDALAAAAAEEPVVAPSLPPPSMPPPARAEDAAGLKPADLPGLVRRLEALLGALGEDEGAEDRRRGVRGRVGQDEHAEGADAEAGRAEDEGVAARGAEETPAAVESGRSAPRPSAFPSFAEAEDDGDQATGHYDPDMVARLRARMRRSSPRIAALKEQPETETDVPAEAPADARAPEVPPPDATSAHEPAVPKPSATKGLAPPPPARMPPPPARPLPRKLGSSAAPVSPPARTGGPRRRPARRAATLVLGSVAADAADALDADEAASAAPTLAPSSGVRDKAPERDAASSAPDGAAGREEAVGDPSPTHEPSRPGPSSSGPSSQEPSSPGPSSPGPSPSSPGPSSLGPSSLGPSSLGPSSPGPSSPGPSSYEPAGRATPQVSPETSPLTAGAATPSASAARASASAPQVAATGATGGGEANFGKATGAMPHAPTPSASTPSLGKAPPAAGASAPAKDLFDARPAAAASSLGAPDVARASRRRWIAIVGAIAVVTLVAGVGAILWVLAGDPSSDAVALPAEPAQSRAAEDAVEPSSEGPSSEGPSSEGPSSEGQGDEDTVALAAGEPSPDPAPVESPPAERAAGAPVGPGPDEPLAGAPEDFSLDRLGIEPVEAPDSPRARAARVRELIRAGNRARNDGRLDEAEARYRELLAAFPDNARATAGLARVAMEREQAADAILFAQRLARLRPRYASNYVLLGDALLLGDNRDAARRAFERALQLEPRWGPARRRLQELDDGE